MNASFGLFIFKFRIKSHKNDFRFNKQWHIFFLARLYAQKNCTLSFKYRANGFNTIENNFLILFFYIFS